MLIIDVLCVKFRTNYFVSWVDRTKWTSLIIYTLLPRQGSLWKISLRSLGERKSLNRSGVYRTAPSTLGFLNFSLQPLFGWKNLNYFVQLIKSYFLMVAWVGLVFSNQEHVSKSCLGCDNYFLVALVSDTLYT